MKYISLTWRAAWFSTPHFPSVRLKRFALVSSLLMILWIPIHNAVAPASFTALLAKDIDPGGGGFFEHATVLVLLPGFFAGIYAFRKFKGQVPHPSYRLWPLCWALACFYFAGEEISWGQWLVGWDTPEPIAHLNDQQETNLHNMTSWLDQKPRALVELFIFIGGCVLPFWHLRYRQARFANHPLVRFVHWISPPLALVAAAALFMLVRIFDWSPPHLKTTLGNSELREFTIAWFLTLYLLAFAMRARPAPTTHSPLPTASRGSLATRSRLEPSTVPRAPRATRAAYRGTTHSINSIRPSKCSTSAVQLSTQSPVL